MIRALRTASTGMQAQQRQVETIANNIANVNTTGFKKNRLAFRSLLYQTYRRPGASVSKETVDPTGLQVGTGAEVSSSVKNHMQGDLVPTGGKYDVAIKGDGFFQVTLPSGEFGYTRDGAFRIDANGTLVTPNGYPVDSGGISFGDDVKNVTIGTDGTVTYTTGADNGGVSAGTVTLTRFPNPAGLEAIGDNYFIETASSGAAAQVNPGESELRHGYLERSNVQVVDELIELIQAQRNYELNSRTIKVGDEMMQQVNQMIR
ncbi:MAG: flagellar basal-body rod protein FlgG [Planctomycetota bacterium]|nr:flagellar basal-body rod protein FlgG [Planctomycetota bacterium]